MNRRADLLNRIGTISPEAKLWLEENDERYGKDIDLHSGVLARSFFFPPHHKVITFSIQFLNF